MAWDAVAASHAEVDFVLSFEMKLHNEFPTDQKYAFEQLGRSIIKVYSRNYSYAYHEMLDRMVERRMRASIIAIGSFWYSTWVEEGKLIFEMELDDSQKQLTEQERKSLKSEYQARPVTSREHAE